MLSLALLGIIAIMFLSMSTIGYYQINNAGNKSKAGFMAQQGVDQNIVGATPWPNVTVAATDASITIQLPSPLPSPMTQAGKIITST